MEREQLRDQNRETLAALFRDGKIALERGRLFDAPPQPLPPEFDFDKIEGMMLELAVGDALGNTTESRTPSERRRRHGEIRDYLPNRHAGGRAVGLPSDDSQMAFWTLEQLIEDDGLVPEHLAIVFASRRIFGIGGTVREFRERHDAGLPWHECGVSSAGNGALMRIAPILIPHLRAATTDVWIDVALCAALTHNDAGSISACLAWVSLLWRLLGVTAPPAPEWWLDSYVQVARDLEGDTHYRPRSDRVEPYVGTLWRYAELQVRRAFHDGSSVLDACDRWYSGAFLLETVPNVLYILMKHGHDPEEALVRAVNDTKDNDTVAAIVGAAVGALHGKRNLPPRWLDGLSGRTCESDDARMSALLAAARARWS